jgi:hypothetical protein
LLKGKIALYLTSGRALADRRPEDYDYRVDVLTRCSVSKDSSGKKTMKIIPLKQRGEPVVISLPLSQVIYFAHFSSEVFVLSFYLVLNCLFLIMGLT